MLAVISGFGWRGYPPNPMFLRVPHLRTLRAVAVPGSRVEIAKRLILHLVELDVELNELPIVVAMEYRHVVTRPEPQRPPGQRNAFRGKEITRPCDVCDIPQFEGDMMHP